MYSQEARARKNCAYQHMFKGKQYTFVSGLVASVKYWLPASPIIWLLEWEIIEILFPRRPSARKQSTE